MKRLLGVPFLFALGVCTCLAQGPLTSYYYHHATELPWAECYVYQQGGSRQHVPFLPVVLRNHTPVGTQRLTHNIAVDAPIVFVGNGIDSAGVHNSYVGRGTNYAGGSMEVTGKIIMLCYDFPDSIRSRVGDKFPLERLVRVAAEHKAAAVVLFSHQTQYPFLFLNGNPDSAPSLPVITITEAKAKDILESAGINATQEFATWEQTGKPMESRELISKLRLSFEGSFEAVETAHFSFHYRAKEFSTSEMQSLADVNEKSVQFLVNTFGELISVEEKSFVVYFRDFDSKLFYTHHRGRGLSGPAGVFNVHDGQIPSFGLAVHENTHSLWGNGSSSFLAEGIAMFAEAMATDKNKNHRTTVELIRSKALFPLHEMTVMDIGSDEQKSIIAYPAAGSFVDFLIRTYGVNSFHTLFSGTETDASWKKMYQKTIGELESEWHQWLLSGSWEN